MKKTQKPIFCVGDRVYDRWWDWRLGIVIRVGKSSVRVLWNEKRHPVGPHHSQSDIWYYDRDHLQFLEKVIE